MSAYSFTASALARRVKLLQASWSETRRARLEDLMGDFMKSLIRLGLLALTAMSLSGCWTDSGPQACLGMSEQKGEHLARESIKKFLHYAGQTHAPLTGPSGTLNFQRLEQVGDNDLVYEGPTSSVSYAFVFHLSWAPWAKFTGTVSSNCKVSNNWVIN